MTNSISMTGFAAAICKCMNIQPPTQAMPPMDGPVDLTQHILGGPAQKVLIYNPDAVAMWLYQVYTENFSPVLEHTQLALPVYTVMPSVTPVCFGTMYTGTLPQVHGIQEYRKAEITVDSLFDALARAGKRTAIVAVEQSSMAVIFANRNIDYFILPYDEQVNEKALELLEQDLYDVIVVYNQEYDDVMHMTYPQSEQALLALSHHIDSFQKLATAARTCWKSYPSLLCWATDHGIHTNALGKGTHGDGIDDDLNVMHFFGAYPAQTSGQ